MSKKLEYLRRRDSAFNKQREEKKNVYKRQENTRCRTHGTKFNYLFKLHSDMNLFAFQCDFINWTLPFQMSSTLSRYSYSLQR